jgi:hypothetical protein
LRRFEDHEAAFDAAAIRAHAERFSAQRFRRELQALVARCWRQWQADRPGPLRAEAGDAGPL